MANVGLGYAPELAGSQNSDQTKYWVIELKRTLNPKPYEDRIYACMHSRGSASHVRSFGLPPAFKERWSKVCRDQDLP